MAAPSMSKHEYLKRYLSSGNDTKALKKKKKSQSSSIKVSRFKIVDDDVDFKTLLPNNIENSLEEDLYDQGPTVAEVVDERPEHVKQLEQYRKSEKWKILAKDEDQTHPTHKRQRHDSDSENSDGSPSRKQTSVHSSPGRVKRNSRLQNDPYSTIENNNNSKSDSDASQNLQKQRQSSDSDASPPRRRRSESDASPPRRKQSDSDASPPRRKRSESDASPPRRKQSDSDASPPRRKRSDADPSPPIRKRTVRKLNKNRKSRFEREDSRSADDNDKLTKTLAGAKAGLSSAKDMRREMSKIKEREDRAFGMIDDAVLGKNAATVLRDKSGKRRDTNAEKLKDAEDEAKKAKEDEKYKQWGKGLKQSEMKEMNIQDSLHEMSKPLARYKDDSDLDELLRNQDREGDPMLAFMKKTSSKAKKDTQELPRYKGQAPPPARFGIWPGYRWDGVDRSNGFEKSLFAKQAERKANSEHAYKWSTEDM